MEHQLSHAQKDALFQHTFIKAILDNKHNLNKWTEYKAKYENVIKNLKYYNEKHQHSIFLPVGSKAYVRGKMVHTNDVWVTLGAGWFVKTSAKKAMEICERRIKAADELIDKWDKESKLLENMREYSRSKDAFASLENKDIVEPFDEEKERLWQQEHREKEKKYRQQLKEIREKTDGARVITEKDIWEHLEALELQEELEDELNRLGCDSDETSDEDSDSDVSQDKNTHNRLHYADGQKDNGLVGTVNPPPTTSDGKNKLARKKSVTFMLPEDEEKSVTVPGKKALLDAIADIILEKKTTPNKACGTLNQNKSPRGIIKKTIPADITKEKKTTTDDTADNIHESAVSDTVHEKKTAPVAVSDIVYENIAAPSAVSDSVHEKKTTPVAFCDTVHEKITAPLAISDNAHEKITAPGAVSDTVHEKITTPYGESNTIQENVPKASLPIKDNEPKRPISIFKMSRK